MSISYASDLEEILVIAFAIGVVAIIESASSLMHVAVITWGKHEPLHLEITFGFSLLIRFSHQLK